VELPQAAPLEADYIAESVYRDAVQRQPAACPAASVIGHAVVRTQLLPVPSEGPVYFVSYGGAKFPEAVMVLTGDNVHIRLTGEAYISKGVTSATFKTDPDAPFTLRTDAAARELLCARREPPGEGSRQLLRTKALTMPTEITAQNGLVIEQNTVISVTGTARRSRRRSKRRCSPSVNAPRLDQPASSAKWSFSEGLTSLSLCCDSVSVFGGGQPSVAMFAVAVGDVSGEGVQSR
jgi:hypothetical protein